MQITTVQDQRNFNSKIPRTCVYCVGITLAYDDDDDPKQ